MNQEEIMQQLQAAGQAYQNGDLDDAEAFLKQIVAVNPKEPNALHLLGCIYKDRGQMQEAADFIQSSIQLDLNNPMPYIDLGKILIIVGQPENAIAIFQESLKRSNQISETWFCLAIALMMTDEVGNAEQAYKNVLKLDPSHVGAAACLRSLSSGKSVLDKASVETFAYGYFNRGCLLKSKGCAEEAIVDYRKAIEFNPDFIDAYSNLGVALSEEGRAEEAIISYRKVIELKPDFAEIHLCLAIELKHIGQLEEAIASCRKAIELKPDFADAYLNLGNFLKEEGEVEGACNAFAEHYRLKPIAQSVSFASNVASQSLNTESVVKVPEGAEFIPSYVSDAIPFGMHMMHVHIPKAGGVRFSNPIFDCIQEMLLKGQWEKYPELAASAFGRERVSVMASHRIDSAPLRDGIVAAFSSYDFPALDFSFLIPHGVSSRELSLAMRDQFDVQPIRLATWREPRKRMKSALDYLYRTSKCDLDFVREKIDQKDPFLDNAIYRGCFSDFSPKLWPDDRYDTQIDYLIDIGDFSVMNQVMSSFQSSCRLPNIVVNKQVNVTSADKRMDPAIADSLMEQCVEAGFVTLDYAPEIERMVSRELPEEFDLRVDTFSASLHPLTFVVSAATDVRTSMNSYLLPTEYLLTNQGQEFLRKTFAY